MPVRRWLSFLALIACLCALASPPAARQTPTIVPPAPVQALGPLAVSSFRAAPAVERAVAFLLTLQPTGSYILSSAGGDDVAPMDLAHAALALCQAGDTPRAEAALDWLLARQTRRGEPGATVVRDVDGVAVAIDYAGSWYDHYSPDGTPKADLTRGRGEAVGLTLIALGTVTHADSSYATHLVAGIPIADYVAQSVGYLSQPALQEPDGRFHHRPDYPVAFGEEAARMGLGLRLAAELLAAAGQRYAHAATLAAMSGERGLARLAAGDLNVGMAYDLFARALWGLGTVAEARDELAATRSVGLALAGGVRHYDWQRTSATDWRERLRWWAREQVLGASESFDWGLACLAGGDLAGALGVEATWLAQQRPDGGMPDGYLPLTGQGLGTPTGYAAARFILFERALTAATAPPATLATR